MKNLISLFYLLIFTVSISHSQIVIAYDNSMHEVYETNLLDTVWVALGTEQSKGGYSYLDWEEYSEDKEGNQSYTFSFKFFLTEPYIIYVPYIYGFSKETEEIIFEKRIGIQNSIEIIDYLSVDIIVHLIKNGNITAILLNEEGDTVDKDDTYNFGILDTHQVIIKNGKIIDLSGFSLW